MAEKLNVKNYSNTYLYNTTRNYETQIFKFIMNAERIDKDSEAFEDIKYEVKKRQITSVLSKVLESKNVVLLNGNPSLGRSFKVFYGADVKDGRKPKVFIDCDMLHLSDGKWKPKTSGSIDILVSYLVSAMNAWIYYVDPRRIVSNTDIIHHGASCFAALFTNIIDYLQKISTISSSKDRVVYLSALYYQINILQKDLTDGVKNVAMKISGLSEREADILHIQLENNSFLNIKYFLETVTRILKIDTKVTLELFVEKWLYLYGTGTGFGLELYPAFASMITDAYVGAYINNQKTIERVTGKDLVNFTNAILKIGSDSI